MSSLVQTLGGLSKKTKADLLQDVYDMLLVSGFRIYWKGAPENLVCCVREGCLEITNGQKTVTLHYNNCFIGKTTVVIEGKEIMLFSDYGSMPVKVNKVKRAFRKIMEHVHERLKEEFREEFQKVLSLAMEEGASGEEMGRENRAGEAFCISLGAREAFDVLGEVYNLLRTHPVSVEQRDREMWTVEVLGLSKRVVLERTCESVFLQVGNYTVSLSPSFLNCIEFRLSRLTRRIVKVDKYVRHRSESQLKETVSQAIGARFITDHQLENEILYLPKSIRN